MGISPGGGSLGLTQSVSQALSNFTAMYGLKKTKQEIEQAALKVKMMKLMTEATNAKKELEASQLMPNAPVGGQVGQNGTGNPIPSNMQSNTNQAEVQDFAKTLQEANPNLVAKRPDLSALGKLGKPSAYQVPNVGGSTPADTLSKFGGGTYRIGKDMEPEFVSQDDLDKEKQDALKSSLEISDLQRKQQESTPEGKKIKAEEDIANEVAKKEAIAKSEREMAEKYGPADLEKKRGEMIAKLSMEGLSGEKGTKLSQSLTGQRGLDVAEGLMLSTDSAGKTSLNRKIMLLAKSPQILQSGAKKLTNLPIVKQITKQFGVNVSPAELVAAQTLRSHMRDAIDMRLRLETGANAPISEVESELDKFLASALSEPEAVKNNLGQMRSLFDTTSSLIDPSGFFSGKASGNNKSLDSMSIQELEALYNSLPSGEENAKQK